MLSIQAYAKVNLYLDVVSRYPNGYHQIESVMQSVSLHDLIEIAPAQSINVSCTDKALSGENNLAFRAATLLRDQKAPGAGAAIKITKHIPVAAGLAGGSADAAATLTGLNILWDLNLSIGELQSLGFELGADVPFCLAGGTMLAEGRGEKLTRLKPMPKIPIVIITPPIHVSTASVYRALDDLFDERGVGPLREKDAFLHALSGGKQALLSRSLANLLEAVTLSRYRAIAKIKEVALEAGALGAIMSGSGPSVFALCEDDAQAREVAGAEKLYGPEFFVEIVRPVDYGVQVV